MGEMLVNKLVYGFLYRPLPSDEAFGGIEFFDSGCKPRFSNVWIFCSKREPMGDSVPLDLAPIPLERRNVDAMALASPSPFGCKLRHSATRLQIRQPQRTGVPSAVAV